MNETITKKSKPTTPKSKPITDGKVVHRLPGRIRVRIDRLHDDITYSNDLQQAATDLNGVTEVRVNALASSIVITYRPSELSEQHLLDCLGVSLPTVKVARKPIDGTVTDKSEAPPEGDSVESAEKLTAEITSEAIGEVVGEALGELLMGPIGTAIGAEIGAKIGEEVSDAILEMKGSANEHFAEESIDSVNEQANPNSPPIDVGKAAAAQKQDRNSQKLQPLNPPPNRHNQKTPKQKK